MSVTLKELEKIARTYGEWAYKKIEGRLSDEPAEMVGPLLWEGLRKGSMPVGSFHGEWAKMLAVAEEYDAGDYIKLMKAIEAEETKRKSSFTGTDKPEGWPGNLEEVWEAKAGERAFFAELLERLREVPRRSQSKVAVLAVKYGGLKREAIPKGKLGDAVWMHGFEWLFAEIPELAEPALMELLQSPNKGTRDHYAGVVAKWRQELNVEAIVEALLKNSKKDMRLTGVTIVEILKDPAYVAMLEAAAQKERSKPAKEAMEAVITALTTPALDVSRFPMTATGDRELNEALAKRPKTALPSELEQNFEALPVPSYESGEEMSRPALKWFLGKICESGESGESGEEEARAVRARLDDEDCHELCEVLLEIAPQDDQGLGLKAQAYMAGPKQIESLGRRLEKFAQSAKYGWSGPVVDILVREGSDLAVRILDDWAQRTRRNALKTRASEGVRQIAVSRGITEEELVEQATGDLGFDESGARVFDYGSRKVVVRLNATGDGLVYEDEEGGSFVSMPSARKDDDEELAEVANDEVSRMKRDMKRIRRIRRHRLEAAMVNERRWTAAVWEERFAENVLVQRVAYGLVWGIYGEVGALKTAFLLDDDGQPVDIEQETPTWSKTDRIGVVHPLEMGDEREIWLKFLADYERVQPFEQLNRRIGSLEEIEDVEELLKSMEPVEAGAFLGRLHRLGCDLGPREGAGLIGYSQRAIGGSVITVRHTDFVPEGLGDAGLIDVEGVSIQQGDEGIEWSKASALVVSEVFRDIHVLLDK